MPIPIRLEEGHGIRSVLGEWAQHIERAVREHFPALEVARTEHDHAFILHLSEKGALRGEVVLRWDPAAPHELSIFPQPAREGAARKAHADTLAYRVAAACVIAASALWLGAAVGFWKDFMDIGGMRGKVVVLTVAVLAWVFSSFGLAMAAYYLVGRSHRAIDAPRVERSRQWLDEVLWPWLLGALDELSQRARSDPGLAGRLAADF
jgi:hypothetical protein